MESFGKLSVLIGYHLAVRRYLFLIVDPRWFYTINGNIFLFKEHRETKRRCYSLSPAKPSLVNFDPLKVIFHYM